MNSPGHWNSIYRAKNPEQLSWTQMVPVTSLKFVRGFELPKTAKIIDIGGGDSRLVDCLSIARRSIHPGGYAVIGTFSDNGPEKCSGLPVRQYSEQTLTEELNRGFQKIKCITEDHRTPFDTIQNFLFCSFKRA